MRISEPYTIFPRKLASGKVVYYYQYRDDYGVRSSAKSTGCTTKAQALRFCQKMFNNNEFSRDSSMLFKTFATDFFSLEGRYCKWKKANQNDITPSTRTSYERLLTYQVMPFFENMKLCKISKQAVKDWIVWVTDNWSAKTSNNAQSVLNIILTDAYDRELIRTVPTANIKLRKVEKKERELLTVDELKKIVQSNRWFTSIDRQIFITSIITGMRIGEVIGLKKEDVLTNCLDVKRNYDYKFKEGQTKTKKNRFVPIPKNYNNVLLDGAGEQWVFERNGKPIPSHTVYMTFCKICNDIGINKKDRGLTIHTLRNFFISYMISKNVPKSKIKAVVGHADEDMTDWYTYWKPDMFQEVYTEQQALYDFIC